MEISVLFCGEIRRPEFAIHALRSVRQCIDEGIVQSAMISTWEGEIQSHGDLVNVIEDFGITLAETSFREDVAYAPHSTYYQATHMQVGCDVIEDGNWIFKSRLDMGFNATPGFKRHLVALRGKDWSVNSSLPHYPFENRLWVGASSFQVPFWYGDRFTFSTKADLQKIISFSSEFEFLLNPATSINEVRCFANPFIRSHKIIRNILRLNWVGPEFSVISGQTTRPELNEQLAQYKFFWIAHAVNFLVLNEGFYLGVDDVREEEYMAFKTMRRPAEGPYPAYGADDIYREFIPDPRFKAALELVSDPSFHEQYNEFDDPYYENMAKGMVRMGYSPFPSISVRMGSAPLSARENWVEAVTKDPERFESRLWPDTAEAAAELKQSGQIAIDLITRYIGPDASRQMTINVLIYNKARALKLPSSGEPILLKFDVLDEMGKVLEDASGGQFVGHNLVRYFSTSLTPSIPDGVSCASIRVRLVGLGVTLATAEDIYVPVPVKETPEA